MDNDDDYEVEAAVETAELGRIRAAYAERAARETKFAEISTPDRPKCPTAPFATGVLAITRSPGWWPRCLLLAVLFLAAAALTILVLAMLASMAFVGVFGLVLAVIVNLIVLAYAAAMFVAIVTATAMGLDHVEEWPRLSLGDNLGELLTVGVALVIACLPGYAIAKLTGGPLLLSMDASSFLLFPVILLSQLEIGSPWGVVSPGVVQTILRAGVRLAPFLLFSAILWFAPSTVLEITQRWPLPSLLLTMVVTAVTWLLYARYIGRLAWLLDELEAKRKNQ